MLLKLVISLFLSSQIAYAFYEDDCSDLIGDCEYYTCIESQRISCGDQDYSIAYGRHYCQEFSRLQFSSLPPASHAKILFPADGNSWRDQVRSCLHIELERYFAESSEISCQSLRTFAFESHPTCYTQGPSFCELSPDKIAKIGLTIGLDGLLTAESYEQVRSTAAICTQQLDDSIAISSSPRVRLELRHYRKLWQLIADDPLHINLLLSGN